MKPTLDPESQRITAIGATLGLTRRESAVVAMLHAEGSDKLIAAKMSVSPHTVRSHLRSIFEKLGVTGRIGAVIRWERESVLHSQNLLVMKCDTRPKGKALK